MTDPARVTDRPGRLATFTLALSLAVSLGVGLTACTQGPQPSPSASTSASVTPAPAPTPGQTPATALQPTGEPTTIQTGLNAPWSMLALPTGSTLISERDSGQILERPAEGGTRSAGTVPGVVHDGEGGLLGLAAAKVTEGGKARDPAFVYAYLTTSDDNRVVRMPLSGSAGNHTLGAPQEILTGIPKAGNHNGGRIAFGPDGMLYITAGDASRSENAQNPKSLGGKILRVKPDGSVPADNPFPDSPVYSLGHRNPQGIAWDAHGTMWASEFGQNTWDELNIITPGANYGWPIVEGIGHQAPYVDPVSQWSTDEASPSGIAIAGDTIFMATLRGERLWVIYSTAGAAPVQAVQWYPDAFGRLRDVAVVQRADGGQTLWLLTNNTDGRGSPRDGDDRIVQVALGPRQ